MTRTRASLLAALLPLLVLLAGCWPPDGTPLIETTTSPTAPAGPVGGPTAPDYAARSAPAATPTGLATDVLTTLTVRGRAPMTGYSRDQFPHWSDVDGDGCDTRAEILTRDALDSRMGAGGCIADVSIVDPYSGAVIDGKTNIDIDHVVALGNAWASGAGQLDLDTRERLANDPLGLLAVDDRLNRQKSDGDAATWLPPDRTFRCTYVATQVAVKATYGLSVTPAERDAIARVLDTCPDQTVPLAQDMAA